VRKDVIIAPSDDLPTVAFKICTALERAGIRAVLTGGSAAAVYAPEAYQSDDVDFIASFTSKKKEFDSTLLTLGFVKNGRIYAHPQIVPTLDFPDDELLIGDELIKETRTMVRGSLFLHILTPEDCIRDRVSWFYFYNDLSALAAAVGVALAQDADLKLVSEWSLRVGESDKFKVFESRLKRKNSE
jgi:hypothetical protein